jgi:ferritin-like protein
MKLVRQCVKSYVKGEGAQRRMWLKSGQYAFEYLALRLANKDPRANAILVITGELAQVASTRVDPAHVNDLIGSYQAHRLLTGSDDVGMETPFAWSNYKEHWSQLVQAKDLYTEDGKRDRTREEWILLPGFETECLDCFKSCVEQNLRHASLKESVAELMANYGKFRKQQAEMEAEASQRQEEAAREVLEDAKAELVAHAETVAQLETAVAVAPPEQKAELQAQAAKAKAELIQQQKETIAANSIAEQALREKAKADQEAAKAAQLAERTERKLVTVQEGKPRKQLPEPRKDNPVGQLIQSAKEATAKDWMDVVKSLILEHADHEDVMVMLLMAMKPECSKSFSHAVDAFGVAYQAAMTRKHTANGVAA